MLRQSGNTLEGRISEGPECFTILPWCRQLLWQGSKKPLNKLRRGIPWRFEEEEKEAFDRVKKALSSCAVIVPYNPQLPVKIDTDASATGIGAVISHMMEIIN